jgi:hypothetical protein
MHNQPERTVPLPQMMLWFSVTLCANVNQSG